MWAVSTIFFHWCSSVPCKSSLGRPVVSKCTLGQPVAFQWHSSVHWTSQCTLAQGKGNAHGWYVFVNHCHDAHSCANGHAGHYVNVVEMSSLVSSHGLTLQTNTTKLSQYPLYIVFANIGKHYLRMYLLRYIRALIRSMAWCKTV